MLLFAIFVNSLLIGSLLYNKLWYKFPCLSLIATLGLLFSPILHYENGHANAHFYMQLYYGIDGVTGILYLVSVIRLRLTPLAPIALSQLMYLSVKFTAWTFLILGLHDARIDYSTVARFLNLPLIAFWILVVWFYGKDAQKGEPIMRGTDPSTPIQQPTPDPDGPVPGKPTGH